MVEPLPWIPHPIWARQPFILDVWQSLGRHRRGTHTFALWLCLWSVWAFVLRRCYLCFLRQCTPRRDSKDGWGLIRLKPWIRLDARCTHFSPPRCWADACYAQCKMVQFVKAGRVELWIFEGRNEPKSKKYDLNEYVWLSFLIWPWKNMTRQNEMTLPGASLQYQNTEKLN